MRDLFKDYFVAAAFNGQLNIYHRQTKKIHGAFGYLIFDRVIDISVPAVYWEAFSPLIVEYVTNHFLTYVALYKIR